ncbi:hypothetical protein EDD22DRAFT_853440 [Suillus occidentalis]|nr:hypothetical protein EDD22DRAFT_853440 [Suillus occidentalis]
MLALEAVTHEQRHAFDTEDTPFVYESTPPWHQTDRRMTRQFVSRSDDGRVEQSELLKIEETFSLPISYQLPKIGMLTHPNVDRGNCCELCESAQTPYMYSSVLNDRLQNGVKRRVMIDLDCQGHLPEGECLTFGDCSNKLACVDLVSSFKFNSSYTFTTFTIEPTPIIDLATSRAQANPHILGMRLKNGLVKMALWDSKILRSLKVMYKCRSYVLHMFQIMVKVEHRAGLRERRDDLRALSGFVEASSLTCHTTSGSTGKTMGVVHITSGYLLCAAVTVERHHLTQFYSAPNAIRLLRRLGACFNIALPIYWLDDRTNFDPGG